MGYKNCCSVGYEVERVLSGHYNIDSHGDISGFYSSITNADLPKYVNMSMFYRQSDHEVFSEIKYDKVLLRYDDGSRGMRNALRGPPIEAYIPMPVIVPDGFTATSVIVREPEVRTPEAPKNAAEEILKAQAEVLGKGLIIRAMEIEEEIHLKRTIRKIEIIRKDLTQSKDKNLKTIDQ